MKVIAVTQMRMGSTRLPGKVLKKIEGKSLMEIHLHRVSQAKTINKVIVATTIQSEDDAIVEQSVSLGFDYFRGDVNDVLARFYFAAKPETPDYIVRITGDCPLLDPMLIDAVVMMALANQADYVSNVLEEHFPDGQDVEVISWRALEEAFKSAQLSSDREHVTPYIRNNSTYKGGDLFTSLNFPCIYNLNEIRMTVDEPADFDLISILISQLGIDKSWKVYSDYIIKEKLNTINGSIIRNEGLLKSINANNHG